MIRLIFVINIVFVLSLGMPGFSQSAPQSDIGKTHPAHAFRLALPGYEYLFPADHGAHPAFQTEWWYYTGNLQSPEGRPFGFELTIFRRALLPPADPARPDSPLLADQVYLGHFAISDIRDRRHQSWERIGRTGLGQASASTRTLGLTLGDWSVRLTDDGAMHLRASNLQLTGEGSAAALDLTLTPSRPLVLHGENGVHQKADRPGQASHYISFTRLAAAGSLTWQGQSHAVSGQAWMDHEFGSDQLGDEEIGWDWFALQLDSGHDLMLYQLRRADGSVNPHSRGTLVLPDGEPFALPGSEYHIEATGQWTSPRTGATYPMGWRIRIPAREADLTVTPRFEAQEMLTSRLTGAVYWEGAVSISGQWQDAPVNGLGYVELVGYQQAMDNL